MNKYNCNNTLDYAHEYERICNKFRGCNNCPLRGLTCSVVEDITPEHIRRVQAWSDANPEPIILTDNQRELLKALNLLGFRYIAQDSDSSVCAYTEKPVKEDEMWTGSGGYLNFKYSRKDGYATVPLLVEWSDDEPLNIEEVLKNGKKLL